MNITTLEECLNLLGAKSPFLSEININESIDPFTSQGWLAYNNLISILYYLEEQDVVCNIRIDELDKIANLES